MKLSNSHSFSLFPSFFLCQRSYCESQSVTHQGGNTGHSSNAFHLHRLGKASCFSMDALISVDTNMHLAQTRCEQMQTWCTSTHIHAHQHNQQSENALNPNSNTDSFSTQQVFCALYTATAEDRGS